MKRSLLALCLCLFTITVVSCKKTVQDQQKNLVVQAMTDGIWIVNKYMEGTSDVTTSFDSYEFKFNANGTVTGTKSGSTSNGTWAADVVNYSITSNFPSAGDPLPKLNGVWKITDSYWDYVEAEMTTAAGTNLLYLQKKP